MSRLPPLKLNLKSETPRSDDSTSLRNINSSARERRRRRDSQSQALNSSISIASPPRRTPIRKQSQENQGFVSDETNLSPKAKKTRKSSPTKGKRKRTNARDSNPNFLKGLEDDIVDDIEETSNRSQQTRRALLSEDDSLILPKKSQPTDKYYVEYGRRFEEQNKIDFEKKEELRRQRELELAQRERERQELKYQILTPKIALNVHKLLSIVFLFIHGINVGYQFWHAIVINTLDTNGNTSVNVNSTNVTMSDIFLTFKSLALPSNCVSYLFITLCLIDSMDRVDFTRMDSKYLIKCITFQNNFWSVVFYFIALALSLVMIFIDDNIYIESITNKANGFIQLNNVSTFRVIHFFICLTILNQTKKVYKYLEVSNNSKSLFMHGIMVNYINILSL
jgi:hypothetical protein